MRQFILISTIIALGTCSDYIKERAKYEGEESLMSYKRNIELDPRVTDYFIERAKLEEEESLMSLGGRTSLDPNETIVNECLMRHKCKELDYAFEHQHFNLSRHYFTYQQALRRTPVWHILRDLPKGASLHSHDMALLGPDYIVNITYMDHLYFCYGPHSILPIPNHLHLKFSNGLPNDTNCERWQLLSAARRNSKNIKEFDAGLRQHFTIMVDDPDKMYPTIKETWTAFMDYFFTLTPLLTYRPVWEQYFYDALKAFREDNIMYMEVRSLLPKLYELDGSTYSQVVTAKAYQKSLKRFLKDYPDSEGAKIIYAPSRYVNNDELAVYIETARKVKQEVPDIFAGFDLVGQEDPGTPLAALAGTLLAARDLAFFFHAGETDWFGTRCDGNLYDAILLGAKRIGHAYALVKHPRLMQEVARRDIALEVNVISNEVLSLVRDVRNHPLSELLARGLPVVLASDDPGAWDAPPATDDFAVAFLAASRLADLRQLKALAENSVRYSALEPARKAVAMTNFHAQWKRFVNDFDCSKYTF